MHQKYISIFVEPRSGKASKIKYSRDTARKKNQKCHPFLHVTALWTAACCTCRVPHSGTGASSSGRPSIRWSRRRWLFVAGYTSGTVPRFIVLIPPVESHTDEVVPLVTPIASDHFIILMLPVAAKRASFKAISGLWLCWQMVIGIAHNASAAAGLPMPRSAGFSPTPRAVVIATGGSSSCTNSCSAFPFVCSTPI